MSGASCHTRRPWAQCEEYLEGLGFEIVPVYDTAGAAMHVAEERRPGRAAVGSRRAAGLHGLAVLAEAIQTYPDNLTRFAAIAAEDRPLGPPGRTSLVFRAANRPASLYRCLGPFASRGLERVCGPGLYVVARNRAYVMSARVVRSSGVLAFVNIEWPRMRISRGLSSRT